MNLKTKARKQREILMKSAQTLQDSDASMVPEFYDIMRYTGNLISVGTRINWKGTVKKAVVDLWDTEANNPDNAPTLWADLLYKDGIRLIPEVITVTTLFMKDELGWWKDELYKSLIDNNVYTPEAYPAGWQLQQ